MSLFRKKPIVIEARQFVGERLSETYELAAWCDGRLELSPTEDRMALHPTIEIPTLEGVMVASCGDWIIKGVNGEFYPCKPDIFEKTYEAVQ